MATVLVLFVLGAVGGGIWLATTRTVRKLRRAPIYRIGELPENTVGRVVGRAEVLQETLIAPFTDQPCVYYIAKVVEAEAGGVICQERCGVPFLLVDPSGRAIVDPEGAELALDFDDKTRSGFLLDPTPAQEAFLEKYGERSVNFLGFNRKLRYSEAIIAIGETIAVLGSGVREPDPDAAPSAGYRDAQPTRLRLTSSPKFPLVISDKTSTVTGD